jgi:hypothetical protein
LSALSSQIAVNSGFPLCVFFGRSATLGRRSAG